MAAEGLEGPKGLGEKKKPGKRSRESRYYGSRAPAVCILL